MKKDRLTVLAIASEIEREIENLKELQSELRSIRDKSDIIYTRAKGSILHDFYNCCERIFKRIAIDINEGYEETERWHKALLYRMTSNSRSSRYKFIFTIYRNNMNILTTFCGK